MFVPLDDAIQRATSEGSRATPSADEGHKELQWADPFVVATARVKGLTVVTEEKGGTTKKPKIPSVCQALGVPCVNVLSFLRDQGWSFA
jgi:hypothetical protein